MGQSKYSNDDKSNCIYYGYIEYTKQLKKDMYKAYENGEYTKFLNMLEYRERSNMIDCASRLIRSESDKYKRLHKKIETLVSSGGAVFITLTFTDDVLNNTTALTRRRYVSRYLKENCSFYIANIDFGVDERYTQREHYHACIGGRCDFNKWSYGFVFAEQVRCHDHDAKRVARYVAKLTNHALKVKSVSSRLIYSRNVL